jgi:hypothetical protein
MQITPFGKKPLKAQRFPCRELGKLWEYSSLEKDPSLPSHM